MSEESILDGLPLDRFSAIYLHHTAGPRNQTFHQIRKFHMDPVPLGGRGWRDIGYHFLVTEDGRWHRGRPIDTRPACVAGKNMEALCVCATGDNTRPEHKWNQTQRISLIAGLDILSSLLNLPVKGHKEDGDTLCPGIEVADLWTPLPTLPT